MSEHDDDTCPHLVRASLLEADYARLKAEVERLTVEADWKTPARKIKALEAEVERLRKAGDAVCESPYLWEDDPAVIAWRAAKEGKPSV